MVGLSSPRLIAAIVTPLLWGAIAVLNVFWGGYKIPEIGDNLVIALILAQPDNYPTPKYLVGISVLRFVYESIWLSSPVGAVLPPYLQNPQSFLSIFGILCTAISSMFLLMASRAQLRVILPLLTPIWMLCSTGYIEYYPFIAGPFLGVLWYLFAQPLGNRSPYVVGTLCALLAGVYLGFVPFSGFILTAYACSGRIRFLKAVASFFIAFMILVASFWSGGVASYFAGLYSDANVGAKNVVFEPYLHLIASDSSIFFKNEYVWSLAHGLDVLRMAFLGAGIAPLYCFTFFAMRSTKASLPAGLPILSWILFVWSLFYIMYMVPKLGPLRDVDLFFSIYLIFAFFSGLFVEQYGGRYKLALCLVFVLASGIGYFQLMTLSLS